MNIDQEIADMFQRINEKNENGTLTVKDIHKGYLRLLEGEDAGRVIIKSSGNIDGKSICLFANGLTWIWTDKIKDVRCEITHPGELSGDLPFRPGKQPIDRSQATWYNDNSDVPQYHKW